MYKHNDFENLFEVSKRVVKKGDPGLVNLVNFKYGRIGKNDNIIPDSATGINPCGEQPLESYEVCDLAEVFKTRCKTIESWFNACKYATFCSVTVTLVKTHFEQTNEVIEKNRRI